MSAEIYAMAAGELFKAVNTLASLVPQFDEEKKEDIEKQTNIYLKAEKRFLDAAVAFNTSGRSDELLGLVDIMKAEDKKLSKMIIIYADELKGGKK